MRANKWAQVYDGCKTRFLIDISYNEKIYRGLTREPKGRQFDTKSA